MVSSFVERRIARSRPFAERAFGCPFLRPRRDIVPGIRAGVDEARAGDAATTATDGATVADPDLRPVARVALALVLTGAAAMGMELAWFRFLAGALGPYRAVFAVEALDPKTRLALFLFAPGMSAWEADGRPVHSTE